MSSAFDPTLILDAAETTEAAQKGDPIPVGEYTGMTGSVHKVKRVTTKDNDVLHFLEFQVMIDGSSPTPDGRTVSEVTGARSTTLRAEGRVDLTPQGGWDFAKGKNNFIRRVREALGQNVPGQAWKLPMIHNQPIKVVVGHRPDKDDPTILYPEVKSFLAR